MNFILQQEEKIANVELANVNESGNWHFGKKNIFYF